MTGSDATFVYYKAIADPSLFTPIVLPPSHVDARYDVKRMYNYCSDDMTDNGTEQDWLVFFTHLWQDSVNRYNAAEMMDVSSEAIDVYGTSYWNDLVDAVEGIYGLDTPKYDHFTLKGDQAGVNH